MIIAGTGSRSLHNADPELRHQVRRTVMARLLDADQPTVMSGMAEGFDELLARAAVSLGVPLWCAVPTRNYGRYYWGEKSLDGTDRLGDFERLLSRAETITYVMEDLHGSSSLYWKGRHANFVRNDFMVETADEFLVYNPSSRGTKQCFGTIIAAQKPYTIIGSC